MSIEQIGSSWLLHTQNTTYAFGLNSLGLLVHQYWGPRIASPSALPTIPESEGWASFNHPEHLLPEEYPAWAGMKFVEPCLKVTAADQVRDTVLVFQGSQEEAAELPHVVLTLQDPVYALRVRLHYRVHAQSDIIERWAELINDSAAPLRLERAFSAQWHPPAGPAYRFSHLYGRWNDEFHLVRETLTPGVKVIESRRLTTSHHHNPWFALDGGDASETQGEVWFGALGWSGNWKLCAEDTGFCTTRLSLGVNDFDFAWDLQPGETFTTPPAYAGYTQNGFGAASRSLHHLIRSRLIPHPRALHPVLYNSWEATLFDVDAPSQIRLAQLAAQMGVELFVMDDGWFKGRRDDRAGLGDWTPDPLKFPHGLNPLIQQVTALGMRFGLWVEPEMVNPDSDLYRAHPDWVLHFPTRQRRTGRNQLILNLARPDVQAHLIQILDDLLSQHDISFIKWDMNRAVSEPGWPGAPRDPREMWVRYTHGLYHILETLRSRHPQVTFQSCSGGGGRADLGVLRYADQIWVSDNTEAAARLRIQEGFSQLFPAQVMEAWVTDANRGQIPLSFRFHVSMCGSLGVGGNLTQWSPQERAEAAHWIEVYKDIRPIIQFGSQFRLRSPSQSACSAVQYLSEDGAAGVLFAFRTHLPDPAALPPLRLQGLDPQALYAVEGVPEPHNGAYWMHTGLPLMLGNFESALLRITRLP